MLGPDTTEGQDVYDYAGGGNGTMSEPRTGNPPGSANFGHAILIQLNGLIWQRR